uniref:CS domain-containing protein n=1 Tax=Leersia perrieri TaxID=77586 RepID=A0A0D9XL10_9ORYZ
MARGWRRRAAKRETAMAAVISELRRQANEAYHGGELELATKLCTRAIDLAPSTADLYADRARALIRLRKHEEAITDLDITLELDPNMCRAYLLKSIAFIFLDDCKTARATFALCCSYGCDDSMTTKLLKKCNKNLADEAFEAYSEGDFDLAAELGTLAISTDRKQNETIPDKDKAIQLECTMWEAYLLKGIAYMALRDYRNANIALQLAHSYSFGQPMITGLLKECNDHIADDANKAYAKEVIADTDKAIEFDPTMCNPYLLKGKALMDLRDYRNANDAFELAQSYSSGDRRIIIDLLKNCKGCIAYEDSQELVEQAEAAPAAPLAATAERQDGAELESTHSSGKLKLRYYYNCPTKIVLSIGVTGVVPENVTVNFGEETLTVSLIVSGEVQDIIQYHLFSKVIPENCTYEVQSKEAMIYLAKLDPIIWTSLSPSSMPTSDDYEFSWISKRLHEKNILPPIQNQGEKKTCVFHALTTTAKIELNRRAAQNDPPESFKMNLNK